jgi:hypothetical protein
MFQIYRIAIEPRKFYGFSAIPLIFFAAGWSCAVHQVNDGLSLICMMLAVLFSGCGLLTGLEHIAQARARQQRVLGLIAATCLAASPFVFMLAALGYILITGIL